MKMKIQFLVALAAVFIFGVFAGTFLSRDQLQNRDSDDSVYAIFEGQKIKASDVLPQIQSDLWQLEKNQYDLKRRATEELIQKKFSAQVPAVAIESLEVTNQELDSFLKSRNQERKKLSQSQLKDIEGNLKLQKRKEFEKKAQPRAQIQWKIPLPPEDQIQVPKGSLSTFGTAKAPIEILVLSNFHCSTCLEAAKRLQELQNKYQSQLNIQYQFHFQEADDSIVRGTAEAAYCANDEGKFWAFHDQWVHQGLVSSREDLEKISRDLGLNSEKFNVCLSERKHKRKLNEELVEVQKMAQVQVPSFIINGRLRPANLSLEELSTLIDSELP